MDVNTGMNRWMGGWKKMYGQMVVVVDEEAVGMDVKMGMDRWDGWMENIDGKNDLDRMASGRRLKTTPRRVSKSCWGVI